MPILRLALVLFLCALSIAAQSSPDALVTRTRQHPRFQAAAAAVARDYALFVRDIVTLTEIPAPPLGEDARAAAFLTLMRETHPASVERDEEGNVLALRRGTNSGGPVVVIAAHLDTVFPAGTNVKVRRDGTRLAAPGISDNAQGVAMLIALSRAMEAGAVQTTSDVVFVGDVGEEATGDLRGMKHLFTKGRFKDRIGIFVSIDGAGDGQFITTRGVGSRRYR